MLKLTKIESTTEQRLILEGRLTAPWVADVSANWKELRQAHPERKLVVDLRGVTRVDRDGEDAIALMKREGARFLANSLRVKYMLKNLRTKPAKRSHSRGEQAH
jgi:ABC-type transporter Mla MlaB component